MSNFLIRWRLFSWQQKVAILWLSFLLFGLVTAFVWACTQSLAFLFVLGGFLIYASIFWSVKTIVNG